MKDMLNKYDHVIYRKMTLAVFHLERGEPWDILPKTRFPPPPKEILIMLTEVKSQTARLPHRV